MNIASKLIWVFLFVAVVILMSFLRDRVKNKKIVFFGDSITQMGVNPGGYISVMKDMLVQQNIQNYELAGAGIGGNKVYDLYLRMPQDVIAQSPDIVVIYVGVNDVWHKATYGTGTDADKFEKFYRAIIKELQLHNIKPMLVTPAVIGEKNDYTNQQDGDLNRYSGIIRDLAKKNSLPLVDLRKSLLEYDLHNNPENNSCQNVFYSFHFFI
jgi:lysophospholipase L1-like esterase